MIIKWKNSNLKVYLPELHSFRIIDRDIKIKAFSWSLDAKT